MTAANVESLAADVEDAIKPILGFHDEYDGCTLEGIEID
jgi:hypothetical protein